MGRSCKSIFFAFFLALITQSFGLQGLAAGSGRQTAQALLQPYLADYEGMAQTGVAGSGSMGNFAANPAGLVDFSKVTIQINHTSGLDGLAAEVLQGLIPLNRDASLGMEFFYRGQSPIDNEVTGQSSVTIRDILGGLALGVRLFSGFSLGLKGTLVSMELGPRSALAFAGQAGVRMEWTETLAGGINVKNIGPGVTLDQREEALPLQASAGVTWRVLASSQQNLKLNFDADYQAIQENWVYKIGTEFWHENLLALRAGYAYSQLAAVYGLAFGVGFRFGLSDQVGMQLDYTFRPQTWEAFDFETENLLSASIRF
jgi:hypothetical protein